jgi:hypothetical protein
MDWTAPTAVAGRTRILSDCNLLTAAPPCVSITPYSDSPGRPNDSKVLLQHKLPRLGKPTEEPSCGKTDVPRVTLAFVSSAICFTALAALSMTTS